MKTQLCEAIVLKVHDVGEADRFCILFTREKGKLAARARAVRKVTSRMGGALLPGSHVTIELKDLGGHFLITSATHKFPSEKRVTNVMGFAAAQEGIELLLRLLQDEESLPEVFDATVTFLQSCAEPSKDLTLSFTIHLLHLLGHLPENENADFFEHLTNEERLFVDQSRRGKRGTLAAESSQNTLQAFCSALLSDQISGPLRAGDIAVSLR